MIEMTTPMAADLFSGVTARLENRAASRGPVPPELVNARKLCRQLSRRRDRPNKRRVAHLICLNLLSMLKRGHATRTNGLPAT